MTEKLELTKFYEITNRGQLKPAILGDDEEKRYFVKIKDHELVALPNAAKRKELVNEFVCAKLATQSGLNCPKGFESFISPEVTKTLDQEYQEIEEVYHFSVSSGPHYAKKEIPNAKTWVVDSSASIDSPDKISQLTKLIVFELAFVHNSDLQDDNFLLDESKDLWVIDHGNCFGGAWSEGSISGLCNRPMIEIENRFTCATQLWHMAKTGNGLLGAADDICDSIGAGFRLSFPCFALAYWILVMGPCF